MSVDVVLLVRAPAVAVAGGALVALAVLALRAADAIRIVGGTGALPRRPLSRPGAHPARRGATLA